MILSLIKRSAETALKLPLAVVWDCISLGNMGDGASTSKVLRDHRRSKQIDEAVELLTRVNSKPNTKISNG